MKLVFPIHLSNENISYYKHTEFFSFSFSFLTLQYFHTLCTESGLVACKTRMEGLGNCL